MKESKRQKIKHIPDSLDIAIFRSQNGRLPRVIEVKNGLEWEFAEVTNIQLGPDVLTVQALPNGKVVGLSKRARKIAMDERTQIYIYENMS